MIRVRFSYKDTHFKKFFSNVSTTLKCTPSRQLTGSIIYQSCAGNHSFRWNLSSAILSRSEDTLTSGSYDPSVPLL